MKKIFLLITVYCLLSTPVFAQSTEYQLLAPLPGYVETTGEGKTTASQYIEGIFMLMIAIAGGLAVLMLIFGGIKYMSTDAFGGKNEAKNIIQNAIWGFILAISAWLILKTINPNLATFNFEIPVQEIKEKPTSGDINLPADPSNCTNCVPVGVPHKPVGQGCALSPSGICTINATLNSRLIELNRLNGLLVTESFPPTVVHKDPCHLNGTCVDATISSNTPQNIKSFINNASSVNLRAVFEVKNETRASQIRNSTGLSASQVIVVSTINNEHFSVYLQ